MDKLLDRRFPTGGRAVWVDKSKASIILNNEFFGVEISTPVRRRLICINS